LLYTPVGVALTLVSKVHGVLAAPFPATDCERTPELADGLGRCPYPSVGLAAPRLGHAPDGRGRPAPYAGRPLGRVMPVCRGPPIGRAMVGKEGKALREAGGAGPMEKEGNALRDAGRAGPVEKEGKALSGAGGAEEKESTEDVVLAVGCSSHGSLVSDVGVCGGAVMVVVIVEVASLEHGVLGYTEGLGTPEIVLNAGALLGLNDSDAGTWIEELYGSGWSSSTGVEVGVIMGATELGGSIIVAPGETIAKLGSTGSAGNAQTALARRERMNVECMLRIGLIYRLRIKANDQRTRQSSKATEK
jgi:hypothetical protein